MFATQQISVKFGAIVQTLPEPQRQGKIAEYLDSILLEFTEMDQHTILSQPIEGRVDFIQRLWSHLKEKKHSGIN